MTVATRCSVLIVVESSDVVFAVDSIPAILAVSREQFIVFSSNAFAILACGRSASCSPTSAKVRAAAAGPGRDPRLRRRQMILAEWYHIPTGVSLVIAVLAVSIWLSIRRTPAWAQAQEALCGRRLGVGAGDAPPRGPVRRRPGAGGPAHED